MEGAEKIGVEWMSEELVNNYELFVKMLFPDLKEFKIKDFDGFVEIQTMLEENLTERERRVMEMRWGLKPDNTTTMTLQEVADVFGVTRERIRQIEAKACRKLR